MPDTAMNLDVEKTLQVIAEHVETAVMSANRLINSAYGRGRQLDPRVVRELRHSWQNAAITASFLMKQAHETVCTNCNPDVTPREEAATQRNAVRILINTGKCSRYRANKAYAALRHAGLL